MAVPVAQGVYYLITGVWPLVSMQSFELVTGKKTDRWLVKTFGALIAVVGASLLLGRRDPGHAEIRILGLASAVCLAVADVNYVARRRIRPVYLVDALAEAVLTGLWMRRDRQ